jgi:hypothetical protein
MIENKVNIVKKLVYLSIKFKKLQNENDENFFRIPTSRVQQR